MKNLVKSVFDFETNKVRVFNINNDILFVAVDVAKSLGYKDTNQAIRKHCEDQKHYTYQELKARPVDSTGLEISSNGMMLIPESDVYCLILRSKLSSAKRFKSWLTKEVIPQIRKTGSYSIVKSNDWSLERLVSKLGYKSMCDAIKVSKENPATYDYSNNADLINRIILGMSAKQYKELNELGRKDAIRDKLEAHVIFAYSRLQFENERLIIEGVSFESRKAKLKALYSWLSQGLLAEQKATPRLSLIINNEK